MTNQQFTEHLKGRVEAVRKAYLEDKTSSPRWDAQFESALKEGFKQRLKAVSRIDGILAE